MTHKQTTISSFLFLNSHSIFLLSSNSFICTYLSSHSNSSLKVHNSSYISHSAIHRSDINQSIFPQSKSGLSDHSYSRRSHYAFKMSTLVSSITQLSDASDEETQPTLRTFARIKMRQRNHSPEIGNELEKSINDPWKFSAAVQTHSKKKVVRTKPAPSKAKSLIPNVEVPVSTRAIVSTVPQIIVSPPSRKRSRKMMKDNESHYASNDGVMLIPKLTLGTSTVSNVDKFSFAHDSQISKIYDSDESDISAAPSSASSSLSEEHHNTSDESEDSSSSNNDDGDDYNFTPAKRLKRRRAAQHRLEQAQSAAEKKKQDAYLQLQRIAKPQPMAIKITKPRKKPIKSHESIAPTLITSDNSDDELPDPDDFLQNMGSQKSSGGFELPSPLQELKSVEHKDQVIIKVHKAIQHQTPKKQYNKETIEKRKWYEKSRSVITTHLYFVS